jgi:hypothetical protein
MQVNSRSMKKKNTKNSKKKFTQVKAVDGIVRYRRNNLLTLPANSKVVPDRFYTRLAYEGMGQVVITSPATYTTLRFRPSAAFDVDPTLASTATPGFAELALLYNKYRVTMSKIRITITNPSTALGVLLVVLPLNQDPGSAPSGPFVNAWPDQPYAKSKMCGLLGSPACEVINEMTTEKIFGSSLVYTDDLYAAAVTTVPSTNWYWGIALATGTAPAAAQSCTFQWLIEMGVEFYERKVLQQ